MARDRKKQEEDEGQGGDMEERKRVLRHASSLNRADVIKKVVCRTLLSPTSAGHAVSPPSSAGGVGNADDVDREVLNHVDEEGLTALHYAVRKSSLDVSTSRERIACAYSLDSRLLALFYVAKYIGVLCYACCLGECGH